MDVVERLRSMCAYLNPDDEIRRYQSGATNGLLLDAATEIEWLRAENARLRTEIKAWEHEKAKLNGG